MNPPPLISVIVAVKNSERYLAIALQSIHAQTYPHHETIISDAHSTDRSCEIARSFPNVRIVQQTGQGFGDAWNCGIAAARGEFIAILDSDDYWAPEKLGAQIELLNENPQIAYALTRMKFFLDQPDDLPRGFAPNLLESEHVGFFPGALLARRTLVESVGMFDASLKIATDIDWFRRVLERNTPIGIVPRVLYFKRVHGSNLSYSPLAGRNFNHELVMLLKHSLDRQRKHTANMNV
jgi:glycosyltransferase involved in cell wall biosynthesis